MRPKLSYHPNSAKQVRKETADMQRPRSPRRRHGKTLGVDLPHDLLLRLHLNAAHRGITIRQIVFDALEKCVPRIDVKVIREEDKQSE